MTPRTILFMILFFLMIAFYGLILPLLLPLLPLKPKFRVAASWAHTMMFLLKHVAGIKVEVEGEENIPDETCIVFANHQSTLETIFMQTITPTYAWILKKELLKIPFFGWGLASMHPIAIDRSRGKEALSQLLEQGQKRIRDGLSVLIFPEGTRISPGTRRNFKIGGAALAEISGAPVLPVAHDAGRLWPPRTFHLKPGTLHVRIGPLIESKGKSKEEILEESQKWIQSTMDELDKLQN